jgi:hypothetical protein
MWCRPAAGITIITIIIIIITTGTTIATDRRAMM